MRHSIAIYVHIRERQSSSPFIWTALQGTRMSGFCILSTFQSFLQSATNSARPTKYCTKQVLGDGQFHFRPQRDRGKKLYFTNSKLHQSLFNFGNKNAFLSPTLHFASYINNVWILERKRNSRSVDIFPTIFWQPTCESIAPISTYSSGISGLII